MQIIGLSFIQANKKFFWQTLAILRQKKTINSILWDANDQKQFQNNTNSMHNSIVLECASATSVYATTCLETDFYIGLRT